MDARAAAAGRTSAARPVAAIGQRLETQRRHRGAGRQRRRVGHAGASGHGFRKPRGRKLRRGAWRCPAVRRTPSHPGAPGKAARPHRAPVGAGHHSRGAAGSGRRPGAGFRQPGRRGEGPAGTRSRRPPAADGRDRRQPCRRRRGRAPPRARAGAGPLPRDPARAAECPRPDGRSARRRHLVDGDGPRDRARSRPAGRERPGRLARGRALDSPARPGEGARARREAAGPRRRRVPDHRRPGRHRARTGRLPGEEESAHCPGEPPRPALEGQLARAGCERRLLARRAIDTAPARARE